MIMTRLLPGWFCFFCDTYLVDVSILTILLVLVVPVVVLVVVSSHRYQTSIPVCVQIEQMLEEHLIELPSMMTRELLGFAIFPNMARFLTHSCRPNCLVVYSIEHGFRPKARAHLLVIRTMQVNESPTIAMVPEIIAAPYALRQTLLKAAELKVPCVCRLCTLEKPVTDEKQTDSISLDKTTNMDEKSDLDMALWTQVWHSDSTQLSHLVMDGVERGNVMPEWQLQTIVFGKLMEPLLKFGLERFLYGLWKTQHADKEFDKVRFTTSPCPFQIMRKAGRVSGLHRLCLLCGQLSSDPKLAKAALQASCDQYCTVLATLRQRTYVKLDPDRQLLLQFVWMLISMEAKRLMLTDNVWLHLPPLVSGVSSSLATTWIQLARQSEQVSSYCIQFFDTLSTQWAYQQEKGGIPTPPSEAPPSQAPASQASLQVPPPPPQAPAPVVSLQGPPQTRPSQPPPSQTMDSAKPKSPSQDGKAVSNQRSNESDKKRIESDRLDDMRFLYDRIQELTLYDRASGAQFGQAFFQHMNRTKMAQASHPDKSKNLGPLIDKTKPAK